LCDNYLLTGDESGRGVHYADGANRTALPLPCVSKATDWVWRLSSQSGCHQNVHPGHWGTSEGWRHRSTSWHGSRTSQGRHLKCSVL